MLEVALLILVAGGSLWMMSRRLLADTSRLLPLDKDKWDEQTLSPIAGGGLYNIAKPGEIITYTAFSDLQLVKGVEKGLEEAQGLIIFPERRFAQDRQVVDLPPG